VLGVCIDTWVAAACFFNVMLLLGCLLREDGSGDFGMDSWPLDRHDVSNRIPICHVEHQG